MKKNDLVNHIEIYISNLEKINDKSKARFFLNYLRAYANAEFGVNSLDTPDIFSVLDKGFFLATIESYIAEMQPAKNVAERSNAVSILWSILRCLFRKLDFNSN